MDRSRAHIMIVDDDQSQGKALLELFERAGYQTTVVNSSVQAATLARNQEFHAFIVDCMLPRMNGVDLVEEIKLHSLNAPFIILYSGIFKDKKFISEAVERTGAAAFLTKPLDLPDVLARVNERFAEAPAAEGPSGLARLYGEEALDQAQLIEIIATEPNVPSLHLPMLYHRLQSATVTGELAMVTATGDLNQISLYQGRVFAVRTPDKDAVFGGLAVSLGFVSATEVVDALKRPERKRLGEKLIESFVLSPHAIQVILEEQLALRLSQTITEGVVTVDWSTRVFSKPDFSLSLERFRQLTDDWMVSKIDAGVTRAGLMEWGELALSSPILPGIDAERLGDVLNHADFDDERDLPLVMRELLGGNVTLGVRGGEGSDFRFLERRLDHLIESHADQNYFEVLGITESAKSLEINRAFRELSRHFNPANLPANLPPKLMVKATQVFTVIETAHQTLTDEIARHRYVLAQQRRRAQITLENEPRLRAAISQLQSGQAYEAGEVFQDLLDQKIHFEDLRAYRLWAGLACDRRFKTMTLDKIPPEERHSAPYQMARGMYFRARGEYAKALEAFGAAHMIDPRLSVAKTEFEKLRGELESRGARGILNEVQSLLGNFRRSS